ncbi:DUF3078 domain-containing protein [Mucilaginibacter daejeonensis]|uniref:DUF3078 domain-containing protein n=1 Tax=Mucilaginibacter daejeonensis TaxID=398049 RepID=UPI001D1774DD|nr:DUF3078 domain-containing protein [Mucilaginibacter daejeonensis]UEG53243.1 DUF3078 domain-containing protein [Mucilaginibacter daejeonensis]
MLRPILVSAIAFLFCCDLSYAQTDSLRRVDSLNRALAEQMRLASDSVRRADSLRRDAIKIDTNLLSRLRIDPRRNALPQRYRPLLIRPSLIPVTMMDYKVSYWHKAVLFGVNFNQAGFSDNWAGGGVNSFALGGNLDLKVEYNKQPFVYTTQLILLYGRSKNKGQSGRKSNDRIFWDNKIATQLSKSWFLFGSLSFESQFDKGFVYDANNVLPPVLISSFMAPGYITESFGFEYKPTSYFDLRIGTGTARQTFVLNHDVKYTSNTVNNVTSERAYNVERGKNVYTELAFQAVALFDKDIMPNLHLNSRYQIFVPYGRSIENIDHRLDLTLAARVNRLINVTITGVALYDKDQRPGIQGTESLALGVVYRFP